MIGYDSTREIGHCDGWCATHVVSLMSDDRLMEPVAAYEGQSGSKDRGDPEVGVTVCLSISEMTLTGFFFFSTKDLKSLRRQSPIACHRTEFGLLLCALWTCRFGKL